MSIEPPRRHLQERGCLCWFEEPICGLGLRVRLGREGCRNGMSDELCQERDPESFQFTKDPRDLGVWDLGDPSGRIQ